MGNADDPPGRTFYRQNVCPVIALLTGLPESVIDEQLQPGARLINSGVMTCDKTPRMIITRDERLQPLRREKPINLLCP